MADTPFNGMDPLRADMGIFGSAPEPQFSVNPAVLDLSNDSLDSAIFTNSFLDETPRDFNFAFENLELMNEISSHVFADLFAMENISTVQPIISSNPPRPSYVESGDKITVIRNGRTIRLDTAKTMRMLTSSGLGMLMDSGPNNDNPPPTLQQ